MIVLRLRRQGAVVALIGGLSIAAFLVNVPILWMVGASLKRPEEMLMSVASLLPASPTLEHYRRVWTMTLMPRYVANSFLVAGLATLASLVVSVPAGYVLARFTSYALRKFGESLLAMQMFPGVLLALPLFLTLKALGLLDTYWGLVVAHTTFALPFCVWMLQSYFLAIPLELEEAAMIDGCSRFQALSRVVFPLSGPGVAGVALFSFMFSWKEYLFALILVQSRELRTVSVGVALFMQQFGVDWGSLMAAATMATLPILLVFAFLQRFIVHGLTAGAVRG